MAASVSRLAPGSITPYGLMASVAIWVKRRALRPKGVPTL
jgi:hypothetical protein